MHRKFTENLCPHFRCPGLPLQFHGCSHDFAKALCMCWKNDMEGEEFPPSGHGEPQQEVCFQTSLVRGAWELPAQVPQITAKSYQTVLPRILVIETWSVDLQTFSKSCLSQNMLESSKTRLISCSLGGWLGSMILKVLACLNDSVVPGWAFK